MEFVIIQTYDSKAEAFHTPQYFMTRGLAIRWFTEMCDNEESHFNKYPGDYTLFEVGSWNQFTGDHEIYESKVSLGLAMSYISNQTELREVK